MARTVSHFCQSSCLPAKGPNWSVCALCHFGTKGEEVLCHADLRGHSPQQQPGSRGESETHGFWRNFTGGRRWREHSRPGLHHNSYFLKHFKGSDGSSFLLRRQQLPWFSLLEHTQPHWSFTSVVPLIHLSSQQRLIY